MELERIELEKYMDVDRIVSELDAEIARLQEIRTALTGLGAVASAPATGKRGRPKGSKNLPKGAAPVAAKTVAAKTIAAKSVVTKSVAPKTVAKKGKRKLSPEGRKRIADAMKKRWAEHRKDASK